MADDDKAVSLMRMALALLDRTNRGATVTACMLQSAIDAETGVGPLKPGEFLIDERALPFP